MVGFVDIISPTFKINNRKETRRKRTAGHDYAIVKLGLAATIEGFDVDTAFFTGNNTPKCSIQGACLAIGTLTHTPLNLTTDDDKHIKRRSEVGSEATPSEIENIKTLHSESWETLLPVSALQHGYDETRHNFFNIKNTGKRFTHLRLNMFPDGGIARFRVYGNVEKNWDSVGVDTLLDFASVVNGYSKTTSWVYFNVGKGKGSIME